MKNLPNLLVSAIFCRRNLALFYAERQAAFISIQGQTQVYSVNRDAVNEPES